jgi:hypothetical protein
VRSTQLDPHWVRPAPQIDWQLPSVHACPTTHGLPQDPQCIPSEATSTQPLPQSTSPAWHAHPAALHSVPVEHTAPQDTQFVASAARFVQIPLQFVRPAWQLQTPSTQA